MPMWGNLDVYRFMMEEGKAGRWPWSYVDGRAAADAWAGGGGASLTCLLVDLAGRATCNWTLLHQIRAVRRRSWFDVPQMCGV